MAKISDTTYVHELWPTLIAEYNLEFTKEEDEILQKYAFDDEFIKANDAYDLMFTQSQSTGEKKENDLLNVGGFWIGKNPVGRFDEFKSLRNTFLQLSYHYIENVHHCEIEEFMSFCISDSWFFTLRGSDNPIQRSIITAQSRHNHAYALMSGVLYLNDSQNMLQFEPDYTVEQPFFPFTFNRKKNVNTKQSTFYVVPKKGKVVFFPSKLLHSVIQSYDENDYRPALTFNIWPTGDLSILRSGQVLQEDLSRETYSYKDYKKEWEKNNVG